MEQNRKLRLLVTTSCPNRCPLCCNNSWNYDELPVMNRWNYDEIMFIGGEPLLFPAKLAAFAYAVKSIAKAEGSNPKLYVYTAICDYGKILGVLNEIDGIVLTPHMNEGTAGLFDGKSMRLNLFPDITLPDNINLSKWQIKEMEWIKDCPVPKGEDFRRVSELWTM